MRVRSPLLAQSLNCFLFLQVLRCFSSLSLPPCGFPVFNREGCPIRKSTDHVLFADPRSLSQLITSFFASESLGIPHTPLITSFNDLPFKVLFDVLHTIKVGFPMCSLVKCSSADFTVSCTNTHYLLFYYSFSSMSMNSFTIVHPSGEPEMAYLFGSCPKAMIMWQRLLTAFPLTAHSFFQPRLPLFTKLAT